MNRKRIAFIGIKSLPATMGVDSVVEKIVSRIDHSRWQPVVYVDGTAVPDTVEVPDVELVRITPIAGKYFRATSLFLFSALHALFRGNYDLVNVHSVETCFVLPILRLRYKVLSTAHGLLSMEPPELSKWGKMQPLLRLTEIPFVHLSSARSSVSRPDQLYLESRYHRPVTYLPNGIEERQPDVAAADELLASLGLEPGKYMLFTAGRVVPRKGCHFVLEAMRGLDDDIKLLVVGDIDQVPEYAERLKGLSDDRVVYAGFLSSKELLFGLINRAQIFVFPTTYEAMAMTMLEVASLGTPLIASDIPENREVLPDQALFFASGNVDELRERIRWALANPAQMQLLARRAQSWVFANYRWPGIIDTYEQLYEAVLGERPADRQSSTPVAEGDG